MSKLELKTIVEDDSCVNTNELDINIDMSCSNKLRKICSYKLFTNELKVNIERKLIENKDLLFCGFDIESEFDVAFNNSHFE